MKFPKRLYVYLGSAIGVLALVCVSFIGSVGVAIGIFASGTIIIFHQLVGKHIVRLWNLNANLSAKQFLLFPEKDIPNNELGDNIRNRNEMAIRMKEYQENLERVLDEVKDELIDQAKLSAIGELTAVISHDLKNPLTIVQAYVHRINEMVKAGDLDRQKFTYALERTIASLDRIIRLVEQMNRFKPQSFNPIEDVSLMKVVDNALVLLESKIKGHGIIVHKGYLEKCPTVWADPVQVEQLVMNLVFNSFKALKNSERKEIIFDFVDSDDAVTIFMEDTGPGISPEDRTALFKPFHNSKSLNKSGGLGLSICSQIMERHGTRMTLESTQGGGARFSLKFFKKPIGKVEAA